MKFGGPIEIKTGMYQLRAIAARVTVLNDGGTTVVVDSGARGSLGAIAGGLGALGVTLEQVGLIVLTHYHPDHSGGLDRLARATSAKVAAHREDAGIISGDEPAPSPYGNRLIGGLARPVVASMYGAAVKVDHLLEDGDPLPYRDDVTVLHTPGHTAGSICLHLASQGVVIVGDALQYRLRRLGPPARSVTRDPGQAMRSLTKLLDLEFDTICFSHFPPLRGKAKAALERLLEEK